MNQESTLSDEALALDLKLRKHIKPRVFLSAGSVAHKRQLLESARSLARAGVMIYATEGTSTFLLDNGVPNTPVSKISERQQTDVRMRLLEGMFDVVINILTGNSGYDERSDAAIIRNLAVEHNIPLITDPALAQARIVKLLKDFKAKQDMPLPNTAEWDAEEWFAELVFKRGGYASYHAHYDKSHLVDPESLRLGNVKMEAKWDLMRKYKEGYTSEDLFQRMEKALLRQIRSGTRYVRTLVDADSTVKLKCVEAARAVREKYSGSPQLLAFEIGTQPLEGVLKPEARHWFERCCELADVIGGLPSRDERFFPGEGAERHLDVIMGIAKGTDKRLDVHVDQKNDPDENETELLARFTMKHGLEGQVSAIHALFGGKPAEKRRDICKMLKDAGISVIICPRAAISMEPVNKMAPVHNSIAPLQDLLAEGVHVVMGVDNIQDLFMPFVNGDMWLEVLFLFDACRTYLAEEVIVDIACDHSLFTTRLRAAAA